MSHVRPRGVVALALGATLAAGLVGVVRQRQEAEQARRGRLQRAAADRDLPPRRPQGRVGDGLSSWIPTAPVQPWGRTLAFLWASPLTIVGWSLAIAAGRRPVWHDDLRCWVVTGVRGPSELALRAVRADANTIGHVVLSRLADPSPALLAHEAVHVRQAERLGPLLLPAYVWLAARYGYRDHPLERAARRGASLNR